MSRCFLRRYIPDFTLWLGSRWCISKGHGINDKMICELPDRPISRRSVFLILPLAKALGDNREETMKKLLLLLLFVFTLPAVATGIGSGSSAPCDNATLSKYNGTADIEINWEPNTITLNWYNDNQKLEVPVAAQTCTYDGTVTVPPQPTKPGYTFNGWKVMGLPSGYTKLEYITSSGTQYINTNVYFDAQKDLRIMGKIINPSSEYRKVIIGNYPTNGRVYNVELGGTNNNYPPSHFRNYIDSGGGTVNKWADFALPINTMVTYDTYYNATNHTVTNNFTYDGSTTSYSFAVASGATGVATYALRFFLDYRGGYDVYSIAYPLSIGAHQIYQGNVLVADYIPARRNSDNVIGLYDTVTKQFLTNSGTGTFVAGPVVQ